MGLNIYQMFVETDEQELAADKIKDYVKQNGAKMCVNPENHDEESIFSKRHHRPFIISPVKDGKVSVWEDGSAADRLMALDLSKSLNTTAWWIMMNDATDSGAYAEYKNGEMTKTKYIEGTHWEELEKYIEEHALPFALDAFPNPYSAALDAVNEKYFDDMAIYIKEHDLEEEASFTFRSDKDPNFEKLFDMGKLFQDSENIKNTSTPEKPELPKGYLYFVCKVSA